jgi:hypothetical protein
MRTIFKLLFCLSVLITLAVLSVSRYEALSIEIVSNERIYDVNEIDDDMNIERESFRDLPLDFPFKMYSASYKDSETLPVNQIPSRSPQISFKHLRI